MSLARNQAVFRAGPVVSVSRLIEGQFPSWKSQFIPEPFEHQVKLQRQICSRCRERSASWPSATLRSVSPSRRASSRRRRDAGVGDASESMPAPYSGEALEIAFNPQFLIEGLESIDTDDLVIKLSSPLRPGLLEPVDREDFSYLVMPIRLENV